MPTNSFNTDSDPNHLSVLLIDDDIDFAIANAEFLEEFEYQVKVAHDDHQALEVLSTYDPRKRSWVTKVRASS